MTTWIKTKEAAALQGISVSQLCRIGGRIKGADGKPGRKMKLINGRAHWLYEKQAVMDYEKQPGGRPRKKGKRDE